MFVELHILQNFSPHNMNRDDSNAPKDCEFGGSRRARISSQSLKRAIRELFASDNLIPMKNRAVRSRRLVEEVATRLQATGKPEESSKKVASKIINDLGITVEDDNQTQYLIFMGDTEINQLVELCNDKWDGISSEEPDSKIVAEMKSKALNILDGKRSADIALFGRMIADLPQKNRDAACQVAHSLSTNRVSMEFDFYAAMDELNPPEQQGAGMLGTQEFNSACFYRYANVDCEQLLANLDNDKELAEITLSAFISGFIHAIPSGKINSNANQNPPSLVLAVVREGHLWNLANAFLKPVTPRETQQDDLMVSSVKRLDDYWGKLTQAYGDEDIRETCLVTLDGKEALSNLSEMSTSNIKDLLSRISATSPFTTTSA